MVLIKTNVGRVKMQCVTNDWGMRYIAAKKELKIMVALGNDNVSVVNHSCEQNNNHRK